MDEIEKRLAEFEQLANKAHEIVCAISRGDQRWTMSVPAQPDSDPDLVIGAALRLVLKLVDEIRAIRSRAISLGYTKDQRDKLFGSCNANQ